MQDGIHGGRAAPARRGGARSVTTLNTRAFWDANDAALRDPFSPACTQMPMGIAMSEECVFDELGVAPEWRRLFHDGEYHAALCRRYNDRAQQVVGRRLVREQLSGDGDPARPAVRTLADIFEARSEWREESWSYWLHPSAGTGDELAALLDRVERRLERLREFLFPAAWQKRRARVAPTDGATTDGATTDGAPTDGASAGSPLEAYRHQRGPVTFATSVYGAENLVYLILDNPDLAARFRDLILKAILERARIIDEERGGGAEPDTRGGWSWADDNCALLTPEMYRFFGCPVVKAVFERYAPRPGDRRFQHSDSAMGHLLPILGTLGLTGVNFGPTLSIREIRRHLPRAVIHGQLAPLVLEANDGEGIVRQTLRDFEQSREHRGVVFATAGSVNPGTRLASLRLVMAAIQELCHY
jgi:uroporphyrinogen decarboxylase